MEFSVVKGVKCNTCGKLHDLDSDTFVAFHGNVTIGAKDGVYGNSKNDQISVFCRNTACLNDLFSKLKRSDVVMSTNEEFEITQKSINVNQEPLKNVEMVKVETDDSMIQSDDEYTNIISDDAKEKTTEHLKPLKDAIEEIAKENKEEQTKSEEKADKKPGELAFDPELFE